MRPLPRQHLLTAALAAAFGSILTVGAAPAAAQAAAQAAAPVLELKVAAQPLGAALNELSRQAGVQVFAAADLIAGATSRAVAGRLAVDDALRQMLAGSSLEATRTASGGFAIRRAVAVPVADTPLPVVRVAAGTETSPTGPVSGYVARRSITATKTDTPLVEVPQSISVIGREEMDARGAQDVMDAVRYTPGVTTNTYGPDNRGWEYILLRGFDAGVTGIYRDGLGQPTFLPSYYLTESYGIERVEVLRGPSSMAFGKGDAGGIVNRISKEPGERVREIEVQYGSFQRKQLAFDLGDKLDSGSDLSYRLVGLGLDSNDQDEYPDGHKLNHKRTYLAPSVRWQPNATTSLTVLGEYLRNTTAEDPYYATANYVLTGIKVGDYSFSHMAQTQSAIGYRFETALNNAWTLRQNFRYSDIDMSRRVVWANSLGDDGHTLSRIARTWNDPVKQAALDTNLQGKLRHGDVQHTVLLGIDYSDQKGERRRFIGTAPDLDLLAPVYGQAVTLPTTPLSNLDQSTRQTGLYAQDQIKFGERWVATLGGRQDHVRQVTDDHLNSSLTRQSDNAFSGRAGLTYLLGNGWAPYASYATSFLPNSGVDANNDPFDPSRGKQLEVGVKFQPADSRLMFTAAAFDLRKTNVITYDPATFEERQIGKQRSRGVELEAKGELAPGLNVAAAYTWLDMKVLASADSGEVGKIPPLVPKQSASLWLDYLLGNGLGFGGGVRYIGERQDDEYNTTARSGVTLFDAAVHYENGPWRFALNVGNVADKKYNTICYHGECYQGAWRAATLTARYKF